MRRFLLYVTLALGSSACTENPLSLPDYGRGADNLAEVSHDEIVLGEKLEDPYSLENMTRAVESLYPTRAGRVDLKATDIYVRFLPEDEYEYETLVSLGANLLDHPVDYRVVKEGDYYHDPEIPRDRITWQYAVVPPTFIFPKGIKYEMLDECFIPEHSAEATRASGIDWSQVEAEAFRNTGNGNLLCEEVTRGGSTAPRPSGRITVADDRLGVSGQTGLKGVKVSVNSFVKFASAYTDEEGYYTIDKSFSSSLRYRIVFKNRKGFALGLNLLLVPASISTLGKQSAEGVDMLIDRTSDRKLFTRAVCSNAVYDFIEMCQNDDQAILPPPASLRIWLFQSLSCSSAPMIHQGAALDMNLVADFLGEYKSVVKVFMPDITLGLAACDDYSSVYACTVHELAHACHYRSAGNSYWNKYIEYIMRSYLDTGNVYGNGTGEYSGYCEVGEMWAFFVASILYYERYGRENPSQGVGYWFYPQIFLYLNERGLGYPRLFRALTQDVCSREQLEQKLCELYPDSRYMIEQAFERYSE